MPIFKVTICFKFSENCSNFWGSSLILRERKHGEYVQRAKKLLHLPYEAPWWQRVYLYSSQNSTHICFNVATICKPIAIVVTSVLSNYITTMQKSVWCADRPQRDVRHVSIWMCDKVYLSLYTTTFIIYNLLIELTYFLYFWRLGDLNLRQNNILIQLVFFIIHHFIERYENLAKQYTGTCVVETACLYQSSLRITLTSR